MVHKVLILSLDDQPQFLGGVKRVCSMLGENWIERNVAKVEFITFCISDIHKPMVGNITQSFFPNAATYCSRENQEFLINKINDGGFTILLNPHVEEQSLNELVALVKPQLKACVVSVLHFSPTHNRDVIRASFFNNYSLGYNITAWIWQLGLWLKYKLYEHHIKARDEMAKHQYAIDNSDCYVVLSKHFISMFPETYRSKIVSINNPSPCSSDNDFAVLKQEKKNTIIWCGRLDINGAKRCDRMLRIWKLAQNDCPDWHLLILGSGNEEKIQSLIKKHKINNVEVLGFCSPFEYYNKSCILCSTSTAEGWGMVLVEAQSRGCVTMAFDSYASVRDIITDGENGVLVTPFDLHEYAKKLLCLIKNKPLRENMAKRAWETTTRFNVTAIADEWIKLFDRLYNPICINKDN